LLQGRSGRRSFVWFHVAAVKSATSFSIYVNGQLQDSRSPVPSFLDTNSADLRIGSYALEGSHLNGLIDEVEIFNRALFPTDIQAIFAADSAGKCKDDDHDGVPNDKDVYPETPAGEVADTSGCSINQLCPCNGPWKNHGAYVSCVAHRSDDFVAAGLIPKAERDAIVSNAAPSSCGKEKSLQTSEVRRGRRDLLQGLSSWLSPLNPQSAAKQ